jgi:hypothetical protein
MTEKPVQAPQISFEEYKKYRSKDVALYRNRIVAAGSTSEEALQKALKRCPDLKPEDIEIFYIESSDELILLKRTPFWMCWFRLPILMKSQGFLEERIFSNSSELRLMKPRWKSFLKPTNNGTK